MGDAEVDVFGLPLVGLYLAHAAEPPAVGAPDVTGDERFTGARLARAQPAEVAVWLAEHGLGLTEDRRLQELGVYDAKLPDAQDRLRLLERILAMGATEEDLVEANRSGRFGPLALELALGGGGERIDPEGAAAEAGLSTEEANRLWRALGFPDLRDARLRLSRETVEALLLVMRLGQDAFGEASLALARVIGGTSSRLAQALVDAFRAEVEMPLLASGAAYADVVEHFTALAGRGFEDFLGAFGAITRQHLVAEASGTWSFEEGGSVPRRELLVGFADLVGYTALSRTMSGAELAALVRRFEEVLAESVARHRGRIVKLIGDGAMFASDSAEAACELSLELCERFGPPAGLPPVRVGLAAGSVVSLHGDYYGEVVNVAARLVALAQPATVSVDEQVRRRAGERFGFERLPAQPLKGLPAADAYRVSRR